MLLAVIQKSVWSAVTMTSVSDMTFYPILIKSVRATLETHTYTEWAPVSSTPCLYWVGPALIHCAI